MLVVLLAFVALALLILLLSPAQLGRFTARVPIDLLQGLGRSCFEGTNKALYATPTSNPHPSNFARHANNGTWGMMLRSRASLKSGAGGTSTVR